MKVILSKDVKDVGKAGDLLLNPIKKVLKERVHLMPLEKVELVLAKLGNDAGTIGMAAWIARQQGFDI